MAGVMVFSECEKLEDVVKGSSYSALALLADILLFDRSRAVIAGMMGAICGAGFFDMYENRYYQYCVMRTSPAKYAYAWLAANLILTVGATFLVFFCLYGLLGLLTISFTGEISYSIFGPYQDWVRGIPFSYVLVVSFTSGLLFAVTSLFSMIMVSVFPSRYVAVGVPVIAVEFLYGFGELLPAWADFYSVSIAARLFEQQGPVFHICYTVVYFSVFYLALALIFIKRMEKI